MTIDEKLQLIRSLSDEDLIKRANAAPDFGWDDEGAEIDRRVQENGLKVRMDHNTLIIIKNELHD